MNRAWWTVRLGIGGVLIAVALAIKSKEGMWLFAVGLLIVLTTLAIGALRWLCNSGSPVSIDSDDGKAAPPDPPSTDT